MRQVLIVAIVGTASAYIALTLLIIANKAWRNSRDRWRAARRRQLKLTVESYALGYEPEWVWPYRRSVRFWDRRVLEDCLLRQIHEARGLERDHLALAIDQLGFVDRYQRRLRSRSWWQRAEAAEKLGLAMAVRATDGLAAALQDEVPEVRLRAAKALASLGGLAALRPLIEALDQPSRWSTICVADLLATRGHEASDELTAAFDRLGPRARAVSLDILARIKHPGIAPWLRSMLHDSQIDVRSRAAQALGTVGDRDSGTVLTVALKDPAWPVRTMAAKALGKIQHLSALPQLSDAMRDPEWWVRVNAAEALRAMGPVAQDALVEMLDDADVFACHLAVSMLEKTGYVDDEVDHLVDASVPRRTAAQERVERLIRTGRHHRLADLAGTHSEPAVRMMLSFMLRCPKPAH